MPNVQKGKIEKRTSTKPQAKKQDVAAKRKEVIQKRPTGRAKPVVEKKRALKEIKPKAPAFFAAPPGKNKPGAFNVGNNMPYMAQKTTSKGEPWYGAAGKGWIRRTFGLLFEPQGFYNIYGQMSTEQEKTYTANYAAGLEKKTRNTGILWDTNMGWTGIKYSDLMNVAGVRATVEKEAQMAGEKPLAASWEVLNQYRRNFMNFKTIASIIELPFRAAEDIVVRKAIAAPTLAALQTGEWRWLYGVSGSDLDPDFIKRVKIYEEGSSAVYSLLANELLPVRNDEFASFLQEAKGKEKELYGSMMDATYRKWGDKPPEIIVKQIDALEKKMGARVIYDGWLYKAKQYEYIQRAMRGEDPDFLAMEYQNPWIELAGSLLLDPTNYIFPAGSAERATRMYSQAQEFTQYADEIYEALRLVQATSDDALQAAANLENAARVANSYAVNVGDKLSKYATDYGLLVHLAEGKQDVIFKTTDAVLEWGVAHSKSMDDVIDTVNALVKLSDPNPKVYQEAFMTLLHKGDGATVFLSPAGFETGQVLKRVIGNGKWIDRLEEVGEAGLKSEELIKYLDSSMKSIAKEMYPSIDEMEAGWKLAKELGEQATTRQKQLYNMYESVTPTMKSLNKINRFVQDKIIFGAAGIRQVNEFFARIYMGYSAGYAARNLQNNIMTILVDQGLEAASHALKTSWGELWKPGQRVSMLIDDMRDFLKFAPPGVLREGKSPLAALGIKGSKKGFGIEISQRFELGSRVSVTWSVAQRSINKFVDRGAWLPDLSKYIESGAITNGDIDIFKLLMKQNRGNTDAAIEAMKLMDREGFVRVWQTVQPSPELFNYFSDTTMLQKMVASQYSTSPEEFLRISNECVDDVVGGAMREAAKEPAQIPMAALKDKDLADFVDSVDRIVKENFEDDIAGQYLHSYRYTIGEARNRAGSKFGQFSRQVSAALNSSVEVDTIVGRMAKSAPMMTSDRAGQFNHFVWELYNRSKNEGEDIVHLWNEAKFLLDKEVVLGEVPKIVTPKRFQSELWDWYHESVGDYWTKFFGDQVEEYKKGIEAIAELHPGTALPDMSDVDYLITRSEEFHQAYLARKVSGPLKGLRDMPAGSTLADLDTMIGKITGKITTEEFPYTKPHLFNMVNKDRRAMGIAEAADPSEIPMEEVIQAIQRRELKGLMPADDWPITLQRATAAGWDKNLQTAFKKWQDEVVGSWGKVKTKFRNSAKDTAYAEIRDMVENRMSVARLIAAMEGQGAADFALLDYSKRGIDTIAQYIYPYQYWYRGSYANWAKRFGANPSLITGYLKYRRFLENLHAGLPDWYKYQLNTGDIGLDMENPMYFNLEATINPLNGLTGVDFNDPYKRVDGLTTFVDDLSKIGPTIWTPYNWAVAAYTWKKYEDTQDEKYLEASKRWMGRLFPQTATVKSTLNMLGAEGSIGKWLKEKYPENETLQNLIGKIGTGGLKNKYGEYDPFIGIFMGGIDPYEIRRANRELAYMVDSGEITDEEQIDAAWAHEGEWWDRAVARSLSRRGLPNLSSFFLGTGYKPRTQADMNIDIAYSEWNALKASKENVASEEYRGMMVSFFEKYPWFEGLLIGGRNTDDRNTAYVYNVLSRIPPARTDNAFEVFGLETEFVQRFYNDKGFKSFSKADRDRFMATVTDLGAILALPSPATNREWDTASASYITMREQGEKLFGNGIWDKIRTYYSSENRSKYRAEHPDVDNAMIWMNEVIVSTPMLYKYYGSLTTLYFYYDGLRAQELRTTYGNDIYEQWDYYKLSGIDNKNWPKEVKNFQDRYYEIGDEISKYIVDFGIKMPQEPVTPTLRRGVRPNPSQQKLYAGLIGTQYKTASQYFALMAPPLYNLVMDYLNNGVELPGAAWKSLQYIAEDEGFSAASEMMQLIEIDYRK